MQGLCGAGGSFVDWRNRVMQSFNAVEKHSSCPSHQQELSSAFSLTVLRDASPRDNLSLLSFIHTLRHTQTHTNEHTYPHKPILSILNVCDTEFISGFHVFSLPMSAQSLASIYPLLPTSSLSVSSRCGWAGENCSSQTVHFPCSAKRPESSGRARAKGCSPRETASLHKPAGEDRWLLTRANCVVLIFSSISLSVKKLKADLGIIIYILFL